MVGVREARAEPDEPVPLHGVGTAERESRRCLTKKQGCLDEVNHSQRFTNEDKENTNDWLSRDADFFSCSLASNRVP